MNGRDTMSKGSKDNDLSLKNSLRVVKMINCVSLLDFKNYFKSVSKDYEDLDVELRQAIEFWNEFATGGKSH